MIPKLSFFSSIGISALLVAAGASSVSAQAPLTLGDAARLAARQNTGVDVARTKITQADARTTQQRAALFPDVSGYLQQAQRTTNTATFGFSFRDATTGQYLFNPDGQLLGPIPTTDARLSVKQSIFDYSTYAKINAARAASASAATEVNTVAEAAAGAAALAYVRVVRAEAQVAARTADSVLGNNLVRIALDQLQAGVGVALDVTRARSQDANGHVQSIVARMERDHALLDLRRALNLPPDAPLVLADSLGALPMDGNFPDEATLLNRALESRADIRALRAQEAAHHLQIQAIRAERLPTVSAVVDQGALGKDWTHPISTYTWGLQVSLPIFDGFRRSARLEEQEAITNEYDAREKDIRAQATLEVRSALVDLAATREQVAAVTDRLRFAEQEVAQAQERFRAGVAGNSDVILALLSLNQTRTLRNDALAAYQSSRVALARATGSVTQIP
ncbi:MAG: TolC family protein [Gemmatimonadaceae bacterium]